MCVGGLVGGWVGGWVGVLRVCLCVRVGGPTWTRMRVWYGVTMLTTHARDHSELLQGFVRFLTAVDK